MPIGVSEPTDEHSTVSFVHAAVQGHRVTGARPVTAADMSAHAAASFKFLDFARVMRITAGMDGGATSAVG
jgi:hypothetical protein